MTTDLAVVCDAYGCLRGLVRARGSEWPSPCPVCKGRGSMSIATLCEMIGEHESTVARILRRGARNRAKVAARICAKVSDLIAPPKRPELFS